MKSPDIKTTPMMAKKLMLHHIQECSRKFMGEVTADSGISPNLAMNILKGELKALSIKSDESRKHRLSALAAEGVSVKDANEILENEAIQFAKTMKAKTHA